MKWFGKKEQDQNEGYNDDRADYSVKKNKTLDYIMRVVAVLAAFVLWAYVYNTTRTTEERSFNLISIEERNAEYLASEYDLVVQSTNTDTVNVTLMGSRNDISELEFSDVKAYVNLRGITEPGEYTLEVFIDIPKGITCIDRTVTQINVSVDRFAEKTLEVGEHAVELNGWTLENGYYFGEITTNLKSVQLKGTSRDLAKVGKIGLRTGVLGNVTSGLSSVCQILLLDTMGNVQNLPGVQIYPDVDIVQANISVYKEKNVPLTVSTRYGKLDSSFIRISPETVTLRGDPAAVDQINSIELGTIDEKAEIQSMKYDITYGISLPGIQIIDGGGKEINSASVSVDLSELHTKNVTGIPLFSGGKQIGTAAVSVIASANSAISALMTDMITGDDITAYTDENSTAVVISISKLYEGYLYEYGHAVIEEIFEDPIESDDTGNQTGEDDTEDHGQERDGNDGDTVSTDHGQEREN